MPIALLQNPSLEHEIIHDLESLFWVLVYGGLHYVQHHHQDYLYTNKLFDAGGKLILQEKALQQSASHKWGFLASFDLATFPFVSAPFRQLLEDLRVEWASYYSYRQVVLNMPANAHAREQYEELRKQLSSPSRLVSRLQAALQQAKGTWPKNDIVGDQFPPKTPHEEDVLAATMTFSKFDASHLTPETQERLRSAVTSLIARQVGGVHITTEPPVAGEKRRLEDISDDSDDEADSAQFAKAARVKDGPRCRALRSKAKKIGSSVPPASRPRRPPRPS